MSNRIFVIARYNENLDWVKNLKENIVIYNKSDSFNYDFPRHDVANYGRETETFLRFIVQYYNQLDNYNSVVFLQGDPFHHCANFINKLDEINPQHFIYLSDKIASTSFPDNDYFGMHLSTMCRLFNLEFDWDIENYQKLNNESNNLLSSIRHTEHCMSLCSYLKIDTKGLTYGWASGCQYQVPVRMIKSKSLQWWLDIHNMHTYFSRSKNTDFFSYVIETVFPLLVSKGIE